MFLAKLCYICSMIEIYTDGCVDDNTIRTNKGGNGFIIVDPKLNFIMHTYVEPAINTTNNRQELLGIINALEYLKEWNPVGEEVYLYSDSQYCVKGINIWSKKWKAKGWKKVKNLDLWLKLDSLVSEVKCQIEWIKGHQKEENWNTVIDELITERLKLNIKY